MNDLAKPDGYDALVAEAIKTQTKIKHLAALMGRQDVIDWIKNKARTRARATYWANHEQTLRKQRVKKERFS